MVTKDELTNLGYTLVFSIPSPVKNWGKWVVSLKQEEGCIIHGYGDSEELAFEDSLKTALELEQR